ncbi:YcgL domain-containing protein [Reinekea thalattae]|uniref:YcgL domain-containing protein FME95_01540 n=1 Tax=Reinekea thalattae TaxID=2593301 RepID=A0A5C8Z5P0_9GAMM|nr:YcgL domain-containing protein [Reinekea thalattae]TXR53282.1 YcgL domain-containing protein [Reinekea thalattae]
MKREIVRIYRSSKSAETYLYLRKKDSFDQLPEALKALFGKGVVVLDMLLTEDKALARVDAAKVLKSIEEQGFYLQLPPPKEDYLLDLYKEKGYSDHG